MNEVQKVARYAISQIMNIDWLFVDRPQSERFSVNINEQTTIPMSFHDIDPQSIRCEVNPELGSIVPLAIEPKSDDQAD